MQIIESIESIFTSFETTFSAYFFRVHLFECLRAIFMIFFCVFAVTTKKDCVRPAVNAFYRMPKYAIEIEIYIISRNSLPNHSHKKYIPLFCSVDKEKQNTFLAAYIFFGSVENAINNDQIDAYRHQKFGFTKKKKRHNNNKSDLKFAYFCTEKKEKNKRISLNVQFIFAHRKIVNADYENKNC